LEFLNSPEPWQGSVRGAALSIVDLIENQTLHVDAAAALWWAIERGASFFVVAGPGAAGKTTLASALMPFLPAGARLYAVDGPRDPILVPPPVPPVYLLINELSNHMQGYVHGASALRAFSLLNDGYRTIGTLHADSAADALAVMAQEANIPLEEASRVPLVLVLRPRYPAKMVGWRLAADAERRLVEIGCVTGQTSAGEVQPVASWDAGAGRLEICAPPAGIAALASWAGVPTPMAEDEIGTRVRTLQTLVTAHRRSPEQIDAAVCELRGASGA
jgi:hypothetical protein